MNRVIFKSIKSKRDLAGVGVERVERDMDMADRPTDRLTVCLLLDGGIVAGRRYSDGWGKAGEVEKSPSLIVKLNSEKVLGN